MAGFQFRLHSFFSECSNALLNPVCAANVCCRIRLFTSTYTLYAQPVDRRVLQRFLRANVAEATQFRSKWHELHTHHLRCVGQKVPGLQPNPLLVDHHELQQRDNVGVHDDKL